MMWLHRLVSLLGLVVCDLILWKDPTPYGGDRPGDG